MSKASITHPDNQSRYSSNQDRWREFSSETIKLVSTLLDTNPDIHFRDLYKVLAEKRAEIAKELGHGLDSEEEVIRTEDYGKFREVVHDNAEEYFFKQGEQSWNSQAPTVFAKVEELQKSDSPLIKKRIEGDEQFITILNPHNGRYKGLRCSKFLSQITISKEEPEIRIMYASITSPHVLAGNWEIMNDLFKDALKAETHEQFIENTGKLMCFLGKMFPVKLGSAAIGEWLLNSLASHKGYEIKFDFEKAGKIGWDFNALVEPNPDEYAKWFSKAFEFTKIPSTEPEITQAKILEESRKQVTR